jgi:hypothetical protein
MRALAQEELQSLQARRDSLQQELKILLVPKDPNDEKNVVLEIRAGTGGDEAALFAGELYRMYSRYAERQRWKLDVMSLSETGIGGIKEVIVSIEGKQVYSRLKYESGVHRVQRVPATEASGRIHTSTATVAVLPEAEEVDIQIEMTRVPPHTLLHGPPPETSAIVRARVAEARAMALERNGGKPNARLSATALIEVCRLDRAADGATGNRAPAHHADATPRLRRPGATGLCTESRVPGVAAAASSLSHALLPDVPRCARPARPGCWRRRGRGAQSGSPARSRRLGYRHRASREWKNRRASRGEQDPSCAARVRSR